MYSNNGFGNIPEDLRNQDRDATRRRLEASPPSEVVKWASASLSGYHSKLNALEKENKSLIKEARVASVELKRLKGLASASISGRVSYLRDMHRRLISANSGIGRQLNSCRQAVREAVTNYQFIRKTISSPLADQGKRIAAQNRMGQSIKDLDEKFSKCTQAVASQKKLGDQLFQAVTKILDQLKVQLPHYEQERIEKEDKIAKLALDYQKPQPKLIAKNVSTTKALGEDSGIGISAIAAIVVGIYIGVRLCK